MVTLSPAKSKTPHSMHRKVSEKESIYLIKKTEFRVSKNVSYYSSSALNQVILTSHLRVILFLDLFQKLSSRDMRDKNPYILMIKYKTFKIYLSWPL